MEKTIIIKEQFPLQTRNYMAQDGTQKVFHSRGFVLTDGVDEFYAEMVGDAALTAPEFDRDRFHRVQCCIKARTFQDKNGSARFDNQVLINRMY